jgi:protein-disulfide isomerase
MSMKTASILGLLVCLALPATTSCAAPPAEAQDAADEGEVAAVVGDTTISMEELVETAESQLAAVRQQEFQILSDTLGRMINDVLLEAEAGRRGLGTEAMIDQEVQAKTPPVSDAEIDAFYEQNKARINKPKEEVAELIRVNLLRQRQGQRFQAFLLELRDAANVSIRLDPPRVDVATDGDPSFGPENAPVTIIEFSDFQCPYCARVLPTLQAIRERYGEKVRVVYRDYPLDFHKEAQKAAEAAQCAGEQDRFWDYHDRLFANQQALRVDQLKAHALNLGLDGDAFAACLDSGKFASEVQADFRDGSQAGVSGTPAFFINGRFLNGAQPLEAFLSVIDQELERAGTSTAEVAGS